MTHCFPVFRGTLVTLVTRLPWLPWLLHVITCLQRYQVEKRIDEIVKELTPELERNEIEDENGEKQAEELDRYKCGFV